MRIALHLRLAATYVAVSALALGIGGGLVEHRVADQVRDQIAQRLRQQARFLASELEHSAPDAADADAWADARGALAGARVTLIAEDGRVLGDSSLSPQEVRAIENHGTRPEVVQARASGFGESMRFSSTLGQDLLYVAARYPGGVVRVSMPLDRVTRAVTAVRGTLAAALVLALAASLVIAYLTARLVTRPVEELTATARQMAQGRFERKLSRHANDELRDLAEAMNQLATDLDAHMTSLRDEGARLRAVLDGMAEGVMVTDHDGRIALWNDAFGRLFQGISPAGRLPIEVVRSAALQDALAEAAREPAPVAREVTLGERTFIVRLARIQREVGPSERIVAVFNEVTELRRAERMRRDFVANASHELRTPIATVRAAAETLLGAGDALPPELRRFADMIHRQSERMGRLVDDMLRLSELESSYRPSPQSVDLAQLADQVVAAARARLGERAPRLELAIENGVRAWADPAAVEQILTNLVDNACKHTPEGGQVSVRARGDATRVVLEVADTGPGIAREHLPRVFERFYRIDTGRAREQGGAGLGLAIVKHLTVANRGEVAVDSQIGKGSVFLVRLPAAKAARR